MGIQKKNKTKNRKCRDCVFIFFFYLHERNPVKEGAEGRVTFAETSKQTIQKPRKSKWLAHATKFWLTTGFGTVSKGAGACACDAGFKTRNVLWSCFRDRLDRKLEWINPFSCVLCYMLSVFVSIGSLRLTNRARLWKCVLSSEPLCGVHYYYFCSMDWYFCRDSWMVLRGCGQSFLRRSLRVPAAQPIVADLGLKLISLSRMKSPQCSQCWCSIKIMKFFVHLVVDRVV